jgi:hypothetical protein
MRSHSFCQQARICRRFGRAWRGEQQQTDPKANPHNGHSGGPESDEMGQGLKIILSDSGHPLKPRIKDAICRREHSG